MLKKEITFLDLDENPVTQAFYFHLGQAEWVEVNEGDRYMSRLRKLQDDPDPLSLVRVLKEFIMMTIGQRGEDNISFMKTPEYAQAFVNTNAYEVLLEEFAKTPRSIADFMYGVLPKGLREKLDINKIWAETVAQTEKESKILDELEGSFVTSSEGSVVQRVKPIAEYTNEELIEMPKEEFDQLLAMNKGNLPKRVILLAMHRNSVE